MPRPLRAGCRVVETPAPPRLKLLSFKDRAQLDPTEDPCNTIARREPRPNGCPWSLDLVERSVESTSSAAYTQPLAREHERAHAPVHVLPPRPRLRDARAALLVALDWLILQEQRQSDTRLRGLRTHTFVEPKPDMPIIAIIAASSSPPASPPSASIASPGSSPSGSRSTRARDAGAGVPAGARPAVSKRV
jgi:hypothetical protein